MTRLADNRTTIRNLDEARAVMQEIARLECALIKSDAVLESKIVALKSSHEQATASGRDAHGLACQALTRFILANPQLFEDPRKITTQFGSFGLQTVTDVVVSNESAAMQHILEAGYDDCLKSVQTLLKSGIKPRLQAGETIPGCSLRTGDTAVYKVAKALLDQARSAPASASE